MRFYRLRAIFLFRITLIINVLFVSGAFAQIAKQLGKQFSVKDYNAGKSNLSVYQDSRGVMFFGNSNGILSFDNSKWKLLEVANDSYVYTIYQDSESRILVGAKGDFGFVSFNKKGQLLYKSLCPENFKFKFGRIKSIIEINEKILFSTENFIFKFDKKLKFIGVIESDYKFQYLFKWGDKLFSRKLHEGLFFLKDNKWKQVESQVFKVNAIATHQSLDNEMLLFSYPNGIVYSLSKDLELDTFSNKFSDFFAQNIPFSVDQTQYSSHYSIATRRGGMMILDSLFQKAYILNDSNGLDSNVGTFTSFDKEGNIWLSTQSGINQINFPINIKYINNFSENLTVESIYSLATGEKLISGFDGAYLYSDKKGKLSALAEAPDVIWKILNYNNELYFLCENGVYVKKSKSFEKLSNQWGTTNGMVIDSTILISTELTGLKSLKLEFSNGLPFRKLNDVRGFCLSMVQHSDLSVWLSMKYDGVYRLTQSGDTLVDTKFTQKHGLPDVQEVEIIEYDEKLLFATGSGFYQLNPQPKADSSDLFIPHTSILPDRVKLNNVVEDPYHNLWVSITDENRQQHVEKLALQSDGSFERLAIPFKRLPDQEYTCIYPDPEEDSVTWIAGTAGLFRFDGTVKKDYTLPFNTLVRQVDVGDSTIFYGNYYDPADSAKVPSILLDQPDAFVPVLPYEDNSLSFHYVATSYEMPEKNRFSYYLEGFDEGWSNWTKERKKEYGNLDAGTYVFHVKSKNVYDTIGRVASYRFEILPPWYQTIWANIVFALLAAFGVWLIVMAYSYRIRVQRRKLKLIVADRTFEVLSQKREIESQNKELRYKNEEIKSQRDAIQHKNSELESYQKEILTINQQLNDLNSQLELKVEKRTSKIKTTLKRLQQTNKELDLFIYRASHDLKGPISRVNGLSTLAKLEGVSDSTLRYLELIEDTSKDMERLLSKLTQVHEIFNLTVDRSPVDIPSVFNDVRENVKSYDRGYKTKYSFDLKDEERFVSDVRLFRLIVENLVENALIFRKNDQQTANVLHEVKTQTYRKEDDFYIKIYDNGLGIDEENLPKIFEMFYRGSDQSKGSGLGLYLVYLAVEKLHGTIEVKSKRYEYTEFTIILPQHTRSLV